MIGLLWVLTLERMDYERANTIEDEVSNNENLALAFDEHTTLSLQAFDKALLLLLHEYSKEGQRTNIRELIKAGLIDASSFSSIGIVDERGSLTLGSADFKPVNFADRDWFQIHQQHDNHGMFVGKPLLGRVTSHWTIPLSRRIGKPGGSFGGVIYVAVDSAYFSRFYQKANVGAQGAAMLIGLDGITLARLAGSVSSFGQDMSKSTLLREQHKNKNGSYLSIGTVENVPRFFSYRTLNDYPLIVAVGTAEAEVLKEFYASQRKYYLTAALGTALILTSALALAAVLARKRRADLLLENSDRHFRSLIENATDLVVVIDIRGVITYISPSVERIVGYKVAEMEGKNFRDFIHPDDAAAMHAGLAEIARNRDSLHQAERRFRHKNGSWITLEAIARNALDDPSLKGIIFNARDITERKRTLQDLEYKNTILATQQTASPDAILLVDENAKIVSYNQQFIDLWGVPEELVKAGHDGPVLGLVATKVEDTGEFLARVDYLTGHPDEQSHEEIRLKDGRILDRHSAPVTGADGKYYGRVWYFRDITGPKTAEERIRKLNQLYVTLSGGNAAIVRSTSRHELSQRICRLEGGWAGVWIGFVDEATKRIVPEAWSDALNSHIGSLIISVDPAVPEGQGPTSITAGTGKPYFCNDVFGDPATLPLRQLAKNFGIKSVAAVPLHLRGTFVGVAHFYAAQKNFYIPEVQSLLIELGHDISFALEMFEREKNRQTAEREVVESEEKFRGVVEQTIAGIYIVQDERFVYVNPRFAEILGYEPQELVGKEFVQFVEEPCRALVRENIRKRSSGEKKSMQYTLAVRRKDGLLIDIGVHGSNASFQGKPAIVGVMQDISERKRAEERAKQYVVHLEKSMLGTIDAISSMVEMRDPYTAGHQRRVAELAEAIARELDLPISEIRGIYLAATIHDLGKIQVPAEILSKPTKLTKVEFELIKTHTQAGYDILKDIDFPWPIAQIVYQHHERLDGSGYPRGLRGEEILPGAKIIAVADTVEAMSSHRPYRAGLGIEAALKEIEEHSGKLYDPQAAAACLRLFREKNYHIPA